MSPSLDNRPGSVDKGDPALSYMPALPQWSNQYAFSTMEGHPADHGEYNPLTCFMTIVIASQHKNGLRWNGEPLLGISNLCIILRPSVRWIYTLPIVGHYFLSYCQGHDQEKISHDHQMILCSINEGFCYVHGIIPYAQRKLLDIM